MKHLAIFIEAHVHTWQYFIKSQNIFKSPKYLFGNILQKKCNTTLATFHQIPKTINFWANSYSIKAQILFGKNLYNN